MNDLRKFLKKKLIRYRQKVYTCGCESFLYSHNSGIGYRIKLISFLHQLTPTPPDNKFSWFPFAHLYSSSLITGTVLRSITRTCVVIVLHFISKNNYSTTVIISVVESRIISFSVRFPFQQCFCILFIREINANVFFEFWLESSQE